jgi:hypothetical protein
VQARLRVGRAVALVVIVTMVGCTSEEEAATSVEEGAASCGRTYSVSVAVDGLVGAGLVAALAPRQLAIATDGVYRLAGRLHDGASYDVVVASQPVDPAQTCTVAGGTGRIDGASVVVPIHCATMRPVGATVSGLAGQGLVLRSNGVDVPIAANGAVALGTLPDGAAYEVTVASQPSQPNQVCTVTNGSGQVQGAEVIAVVRCDAPGNLRITEVGNCIEGSSCWLEIVNTSSTIAETLSLYQLRSKSAIRTQPWSTSERTFALPGVTIPAGGFAVIRGRSNDSELSGGNLVYLFEGNVMPWWNANGFAELLADGRTIDFVRWGGNPANPTTPSTWSGTAPNLPTTPTHDFVIARDLAMTDTDTGGDWQQRSWGTPGGRNDITEAADADLDGIPDQAERAGGTFAGIDLFAMGAREARRDIFVQIDRMAMDDPGLTPRREALDSVAGAFAARGIAVHFDVGPLYAPAFDPELYNLGGGNVVPFFFGIAMGATTDGRANFYTLKTANIDVRLRPIFHYMLFAWSVAPTGGPSNSGQGEILGNDTLVTFGGWNLRTTPTPELNRLINYQATAIMHELGHNLGLRHGGNTDQNYKPNHLSVMNYTYEFYGLPTIGLGDGDRYYFDQRQRLGRPCPVISVLSMPGSPYGPPSEFRLDYSDGTSGALDENSVSDLTGLRRPGSSAIDFNCNGTLTSGYAFDLDRDNLRTTLTDYNDWANLKLVFQRVAQGNDHLAGGGGGDDYDERFNGDVQRTADEEPPPPELLAPVPAL